MLTSFHSIPPPSARVHPTHIIPPMWIAFRFHAIHAIHMNWNEYRLFRCSIYSVFESCINCYPYPWIRNKFHFQVFTSFQVFCVLNNCTHVNKLHGWVCICKYLEVNVAHINSIYVASFSYFTWYYTIKMVFNNLDDRGEKSVVRGMEKWWISASWKISIFTINIHIIWLHNIQK